MTRLFGYASAAALATALLMRPSAIPTIDLYLHDTFFVVAHLHPTVLLLLAGCFAVGAIAYASLRRVGRGVRQGLVVAHFALLSACFASILTILVSSDGVVVVVATLVAPVSLLLACLLFFVNIGTALLRRRTA